jgi:hypothetical protein
MLPLALVMAALLTSAAALPLGRGGEGSLDQGSVLPVDGAMLTNAEHDNQWEVRVDAGVHGKELLRRAEEIRSEGVSLECLVSSP